ncbi:MAG TPA: DUF4178 domain-containing protein [Thermoanaerobaculia bacterium]|nr:DUF4178 domain-containing protein [Thermoanaerobaculia bacterium]
MTAANCPSCGAPVAFAIGTSAVVVCEYCRTLVARTDRGVEDHGKVAALIETGSPLRVGLAGKHVGVGFRITGRTQMRHQAGGVWDEWYALFDNGAWGWLAEAQGRYYVTFRVADKRSDDERSDEQRSAEERSDRLQPVDARLKPGATSRGATSPGAASRLELGSRWDDLVVTEIGVAELASAEGELPWRPDPGAKYEYADLTGAQREFATFDYSEDPPIVFKGYETTLAELGLESTERRAARVRVEKLSCTNCGGPLELRAPDQAERIYCPNCGAGHDVTEGKLKFLSTIRKKKTDPQPVIALGSKGAIDGVTYVVAGFMQRAVKFDINYYWTEYLLYNADQGFRWLVHSDDHWSFATPLRAGEVLDSAPLGVPKTISWGGKQYKLFQEATAKVTYVLGEFYWKVEKGEAVDTSDYIAPPEGISKEVTRTGAREVNYSHARYLDQKQIAAAFAIGKPPRPSTIGPMQPFTGAKLLGSWIAMLGILLLAAMFIAATKPRRALIDRSFDVAAAPPTEGAPETARVLFTDSFDLSGRENIGIKGFASIDNSWLYVAGDLVNEATGQLDSFELPIEYYHGVDDGESWNEGSRTKRAYIARPAKGRYAVRIEAQWPQGVIPPPLHLTVREGVFRWSHLILAAIVLSVFPALAVFRQMRFEMARWKDSAHSPFGQWQDEDE